MTRRPTAGLILIGDELLSGKVVDTNGSFLITELRTIGIDLGEIAVIGDDVDIIAERIAPSPGSGVGSPPFSPGGGRGPPHDDRTMVAVARAFNTELLEHTALRREIERYFGDDPEQQRVWARMAMVPERCELLAFRGLRWPIYKMRNVYVLPGIPEIFRRQFELVRDRLEGTPVSIRTVYFAIGEGPLVRRLTEAVERFARVSIGSYPVILSRGFRTRVTLESTDVDELESATNWLVGQFEPEAVEEVVGDERVLR